MDFTFYRQKFQEVADNLDKELLHQKQLEVAVVEVLDSIVLKLYKKSWATKFQDPLTARSRIFFSVWVNGKTLKQKRLYYNIHALKLRELDRYKITSWDFADSYRARFKKYEDRWPNVSTVYGPLTLMEGWIELNESKSQHDIEILSKNFIEIDYLIDDLLEACKR